MWLQASPFSDLHFCSKKQGREQEYRSLLLCMLEVFHSIPRPARWLTLLDSTPPLAGPVSQLLGIGLLDTGTFLKAVNQVPTQPVPILNPLHRPSVVASLGYTGGRALSGRSPLSSWADSPPHRWQSQRERDSFLPIPSYLPPRNCPLRPPLQHPLLEPWRPCSTEWWQMWCCGGQVGK